MIHLLLLKEGRTIANPQWSEILHYHQNETPIWLDVESVTEEELEKISNIFHFHPFHREEILLEIGSPKFDLQPHYVFMILHRTLYHFSKDECNNQEFEVFLGENFLITFHSQNISSLFNAATDIIKSQLHDELKNRTTFAFYQILKLSLSYYEPVLEKWQQDLDELEILLFQKNTQNLDARNFKV